MAKQRRDASSDESAGKPKATAGASEASPLSSKQRRKGNGAGASGSGTDRSSRDASGNGSKVNGAVAVAVIIIVAAIAAGVWIGAIGGEGGPGRRSGPPPANAALRALAAQLLHPDKGILAADESPNTFGKRLEGFPNKPGVRRTWRRWLLTAPGLEEHISGVILHEETFAQTADLASAAGRGVLLGIKLDAGTAPLGPKKAGETFTQGLDGIKERCARFRAAPQGASFAKWRSVFRVGLHTPSKGAIRRNAKDLAAYAAAAQKCGVVPIVEPEVLAEGNHDVGRAAAASARVLRGVFRALKRRGDVDLGALLLKAAMVTPGSGAEDRITPEQVANATLRVLLSTVPRIVPGIVFLSGGQSEEEATANLAALGRLASERRAIDKPLPWALSFSFGRALQASALAAWRSADGFAAQAVLTQRAAANALAQQGLRADGKPQAVAAPKP